MPSQEEQLRGIIRHYLAGRHATLWGRAYDVNDPDGMEAAVDFITDLYLELWDLEHAAQERTKVSVIPSYTDTHDDWYVDTYVVSEGAHGE